MVKRLARLVFLLVGGYGLVLLLTWLLVYHLEEAVWTRKAPDELVSKQVLLRIIAGSHLFPDSLEARALGLLGDLECHLGNATEAFGHYEASLTQLNEATTAENFVNVLTDLSTTPSEFQRGADDYRATAPIRILNDEDLTVTMTAEHSEPNWDDFEQVPRLNQAQVIELRDLLDEIPETPSKLRQLADLCDRHQRQIAALQALPHPLLPANADDYDSISHLSSFIPLLVLDALHQAQSGHMEDARRSFDAAYLLLIDIEQRPRLLTVLITVSYRTNIAKLLECASGATLRPLFTMEHSLPLSFLQQAMAGEYQSSKRLIISSMPGTDLAAQRLRVLVLEKQASYWRSCIQNPLAIPPQVPIEDIMATFFFENRRAFMRIDPTSYADGQRFAGIIEQLSSELVHRLAVSAQGRFAEDFTELSQRETALYSNSGGGIQR